MDIESTRTDQIRGGLPPHRWTKIDDPEAEAVVASYDTVIAGGGPAGLTAAYELTKHGHPCVVLEADSTLVGGISRTDQYKGYRFDIGGHRFFSKSDEVNQIWREILGDQLITRSRMSRIYYDRKFFHYPLKPADALLKLGLDPRGPHPRQLHQGPAPADPARAELRGLDRQPLRPPPVRDLLQDVHREGLGHADERHLGRLGRAADQGAEPGRGRLERPLRASGGTKGEVIKTLIDSFQYPRLGPGQMWEAARDQVRRRGGAVHLDRRVVRVEHDGSAVTAFVARDAQGRLTRYHGQHFLSTLPIRELIRSHEPAAPARGRRGRRVAQVPRLPDRRPDRRSGRDVPRQLDLHPRARRPPRPRPELQELVARPRPRPDARAASASNTSASRGTTSGPGPTPS